MPYETRLQFILAGLAVASLASCQAYPSVPAGASAIPMSADRTLRVASTLRSASSQAHPYEILATHPIGPAVGADASSIDKLSLYLYKVVGYVDAGTPGLEFNVPDLAPSTLQLDIQPYVDGRTVTFSHLLSSTRYRIKAEAYSSGGDKISIDADSTVDVPFDTDDTITGVVLPVGMQDSYFDGNATGNVVNVTEGSYAGVAHTP